MKALILTFTIFSILAQAQTFAQNAGDFDFFAQESVYSAGKKQQKLKDIPASVYIITSDDIANYGFRTLAEALQMVPGFYSTTDRNYSYLWVRGFGRPSDYNSRILLSVNGHRLNDNVYDSALFGAEEVIDINFVDKIEVVKGPSSVLYGDNAFLATVNVVTKKPSEKKLSRAGFSHSSFETYRGFFDFAIKTEEGTEIYSGASSLSSHGQDHYYREYASKAKNMDSEKAYKGFFSFRKVNGWFFQAAASRRDKEIPTASFGTLFNNKKDMTSDARSFAEISKESKFNDSLSVTSRFFYDGYDYYGKYLYSGPILNKDFSKSYFYGAEIRENLSIGKDGSHQLTMGQEYERTFKLNQKNYDDDPYFLYIDEGKPYYRWGIYAQEELNLSKSIKLVAGLRYDRYEYFGYVYNPRAAAIWRLSTKDSLKLLYGSAFRAPNAFETEYSALTFISNPDLKPEKIKTYEIIYERSLFSRSFFTAGFFFNDIKNLISLTPAGGGAYKFENVDKAKTAGFELSSKISLTAKTSAFFSWLIQDSRDKNDRRLTNSPQNTLSCGLSYWQPKYNSNFSFNAFYLDSRKTNQATMLSPSLILNISARTQPFRKGPVFFSNIYNLANQPVYASGSGDHLQPAIRQDGRTFQIGLEQEF